MGGITSKEQIEVKTLSLEQKDAIKASWKVIEPIAKPVGIDFFVAFFTKYPEYLKLFARLRKVDQADLKNSKALHAHAMTFVKALTAMVESVDDLECMDELLYKIAARHQPMGLHARDMQNATDLFVSTLHPNPAFDDIDTSSEVIQQSWKQAFDIVMPIIDGYMQDIAKEAA